AWDREHLSFRKFCVTNDSYAAVIALVISGVFQFTDLRAVYCFEECWAWDQRISEAGGGSFFSFSLALSLWVEAARCFRSRHTACLTMTIPSPPRLPICRRACESLPPWLAELIFPP